MTDFKNRPPVTTTQNVLAKAAIEQMRVAQVRALIVVNEDDRVIGMVSALDLQGAQASRVANSYGINIAELTVGMMMIPCDDLPTLNIKYLGSARVGHIAKLFHDLNVNYLIVVEDIGDEQVVRGIFSLTRLRRQLGENLSGDFSVSSIADINRRL